MYDATPIQQIRRVPIYRGYRGMPTDKTPHPDGRPPTPPPVEI